MSSDKMKALRFHKFGTLAELHIEEVPKPVPQAGEVLVAVEASGINPSDVKNVAGRFPVTHPPRIPGRDFAGIVVEGPAEWKGMAVWGSGPGLGFTRDGAHAEFVRVPAEALRPKPENLSWEQAAAVGVPFITAYLAIVRTGRVQAGETVLITGAKGAVGRAATQIAHWQGAQVIGAVRGGSAAAQGSPARASGGRAGVADADEQVRTDDPNWGDAVRALTHGRGVDLVLDTVGVPLFEPAMRTLALRGRHVALTSPRERRACFDLVDFYHGEWQLLGVDTMKLDAAGVGRVLEQLAAGFASGALVPPSITSYSLAEAVQAYEVVQNGSRTKQVLLPRK